MTVQFAVDRERCCREGVSFITYNFYSSLWYYFFLSPNVTRVFIVSIMLFRRLSRRNADGNWVVELTKGDTGVKQKVYINVCRPVIRLNLPNSDPCDASAGICLTEVSGNQVSSSIIRSVLP